MSDVERQLDEVRAQLRLRGPRLAYRSLYARLPRVLGEGEQIVAFGDGYLVGHGHRGKGTYVVLTDRRLLALDEAAEEVGLATVCAVERLERGGSGVLGFTGGAFRLETEQGEVVVRVRPARVADAMAAVIAPRALLDDPVEAIRRLGELRDDGLISPEEFEAKKAELLGRI